MRYIKRKEKILELKGERLESYHLNLIQKELNNEQGELDEEHEENEKKIYQ